MLIAETQTWQVPFAYLKLLLITDVLTGSSQQFCASNPGKVVPSGRVTFPCGGVLFEVSSAPSVTPTPKSMPSKGGNPFSTKSEHPNSVFSVSASSD